MAVSYNKLWNLVRQNKMKKGDLARAAEISGYAMQRLNRDEPVQMEVMMRLCKADADLHTENVHYERY